MATRVRPKLRPIECIFVTSSGGEPALMLRDTQGVADEPVLLDVSAAPIVERFNGASTAEEIAADLTREGPARVTAATVRELADFLEEKLMCDGAPFRAALAKTRASFSEASSRPASHAGGAYHADARRLRDYIDRECIGRA